RLALLQRNFVSMASHEFRTPLSIIDGHAQRLIKLKDRLAPEDIEDRAGRLRAAVLRLTHLIDNLLNSSRVIDGGAPLYFNAEEIELGALLHEVCQLHREIAPGCTIEERFGALPMLGDAKLLFQAFSNLLSNAIKYSASSAVVELAAAIDEGHVVVRVKDHGIGIPEKDRAQLFQRYYRGSNVSGIVGTGVGLYLVKMMIERHGGGVSVASGEGEGSEFIVRLPRKPATQPVTSSGWVAPSETPE